MRGLHAGRLQAASWKKALVERIRAGNLKAEADKVRKNQSSGRTECTKAFHGARAFDSALGDCGNGLQRFAKHGSVPLLGTDEVRYKVDRKRPCPFEVPPGVLSKRSCVYDSKTKVKRYDMDLPDNNEARSLLSSVHDEGPKDAPFFWWAFYHLRSVDLMDPLHRTPRDMENGAHQCDMWAMVQDTTCAINYDHTPYNSGMHFLEDTDAINLFSRVAAEDDDLLALHLENLCEALGDHAVDFGSPEHVQRVVGTVRAKLGARMVEKVKWTRWGSHDTSLREFLPLRALKNFVADVRKVLEQKGELMKTLGTPAVDAPPVTPAPSSASGSAASSSEIAPVSAAPAKSGKAKGKDKGKGKGRGGKGKSSSEPTVSIASGGTAQRRRIQNIDEYDAILQSDELWERAKIWNVATRRIWTASRAEYQGLHDNKESVAKYYAAYARGSYGTVLQQTWDMLTSPGALRDAGFVSMAFDKLLTNKKDNNEKIIYCCIYACFKFWNKCNGRWTRD